ncbi:MAG: endo alpha-1,4 polygalactosaminidase [Bauldia litoralis]
MCAIPLLALLVSILCQAAFLSPVHAEAPGGLSIRSFGYRLVLNQPRAAAVASLARMPHDLLVIDYSPTGRRTDRFTRAEVARIAAGPRGRRLVAAYISIGEASEFRGQPVWDPAWTTTGKARGKLTKAAPAWLGPVNPKWPESRKVRFWHKDWQRRLFNATGTGWLDRIVGQGFDAAYLDIVLAYHFWHKREGHDARRMARAMMTLIVDMTAHARKTNPRFFTIPQNGAWLMNDAGVSNARPGTPDHALKRRFLDAIGAIGAEDVYFRGSADHDNRFAPDRSRIDRLRRDYACNGKPVLVIDYLTEPAKVARFLLAARRDGFVPCAAPDRNLARSCPAVAVKPKPTCR